MVQFSPFNGWRFDLSQVGSLADVVCPMPDHIDESTQRSLYRRHPCNVVRLVANRAEPGDVSASERRLRAADFFHTWRREGILLHEHEDSCYVCEFSEGAQNEQESQWGVILRMRLPATPAPVAEVSVTREHQLLMEQLDANITPVVAVVREEEAAADQLTHLLQRMVPGITPVQLIDDAGCSARIWPVTDRAACQELLQFLSDRSVAVVGGQPVFEAACQWRDQIQQQHTEQGTTFSDNDPRRFVMTLVTGSRDPGLELRPSAAVLSDEADGLHCRLEEHLQLQQVGSDAGAFDDAVALAELHDVQPARAVGFPDGTWWIGCPRSEATSAISADPWQNLLQSFPKTVWSNVDRRTVHSLLSDSSVSAVIVTPPSLVLRAPVERESGASEAAQTVTIESASIRIPVSVCGIVFAGCHEFSGRAGRRQSL
ncbi:MAG: DUF1015 family protein [Planctomycetaceae bacterium]|nr:DUF1015 family protein [Planctomycetaceae bacterium]